MSDSLDHPLSSSFHGRVNGFPTKSPPLLTDDYKNGNQKSAFKLVDPMSNSRHELQNDFNANHAFDPAYRHSNTVITPEQRCSDPSTTWEENGNKGLFIFVLYVELVIFICLDTNSIDSMAESSTGESPLSDAHSASTESANFSMDKLIKVSTLFVYTAKNSNC